MRPIALTLFLCIWAFSLNVASRAQEHTRFPEGTVRIQLTDGTTVVGIIQSEDDTSVVLLTTAGISMTIPKAQIVSTSAIAGERFMRVDPNRTRLFFAPTARSLGRGAGYLSVYEVLFPFVAVGAGGGVTLSGGISINPGSGRLIYAAPKVTVYERSDLALAVGGIGFAVLGGGSGTAGLVFGTGTVGASTRAVTMGIAFGFVEGEFSGRPGLLLGGELQVSNRVKLLTENYLIPGVEDGLLISGGLRFFGEQLAADLGLFALPSLVDDLGDFAFLPWIGFTYNF